MFLFLEEILAPSRVEEGSVQNARTTVVEAEERKVLSIKT